MRNTQLQDVLSPDSRNALNLVKGNFAVKEKKNKKATQKIDYEHVRALELKEKMLEGIYEIPMSVLPMDFHKFHAIFRDTAPGDWRDLMCVKHQIEHKWAFNTVTADYPTISVNKHIVTLCRKLFSQDHAPSLREWKYVLDFASHLPNLEEYLRCTMKSKVRRQYQAQVKKYGLRVPGYAELESIERDDLFYQFFRKELLMATPMKAVFFKDRAFFPLAPAEMLETRDRFFKISSLILLKPRYA